MKNNYDAALEFTLKQEGGWTNDSRDPGGATNWGITIADARQYWKANATPADVKAMPKSVAVNIYRSKYWKTEFYDCDKLASGVDLSVFDFGVNSGPSRAKRYLDKALGGTDEQTIIKFNDARLAFLQGLRTWPTFGKGWGRRVKECKVKSLELNRQKPVRTTPEGGLFTALAAAAAASLAFIQTHPYIIAGCLIGLGTLIYLGVKAYKGKTK